VTTTEGAAVLECAAEFGLTRDEILETVTATLDRLPGETKVQYIDELAGALAMRLIERQRDGEGAHSQG
jgi:hypothetical protein